MNIHELVTNYISLRDRLDKGRKDFKAIELEIKSAMLELELELLLEAEKSGVNSFSTDSGTAYLTKKTFTKLVNREDLEKYALETADLSVFTSHLSKTHLIELQDSGTNLASLGVEYSEERVINVRK